MHPDDFLDAVDQGTEIGPTDKNYKVYLGSMQGKFYFQHLDTLERRQRFIDLYNSGAMRIGYPGHFYIQPYFVTLDPTEAT